MPAGPDGDPRAGRVVGAGDVEEGRQVGIFWDDTTVGFNQVGVEENRQARHVGVDITQQGGVANVEAFVGNDVDRIAGDHFHINLKAAAVEAAGSGSAVPARDAGISHG
ncbi:hypothetical protein [Spirosoma pollinicola]|uniref:hypothetical protein n=1 Tax=Spirosoma pollinicola TaxID=2057025 RepID=UPI0012FDA9DD|nr:hypothetical protein [Spirosoma pollinicola]